LPTKQKDTSPVLGFGAVLLSSFFFGFNGYFGKVGFELGYTPLRLLTVRFTVAAIVMWGIMVWYGKNKGGIPRTELASLAVQGVAYALTSLGFFKDIGDGSICPTSSPSLVSCTLW